MAMTRKLWSINGLATELGIDRRTVALRIRDIPPAGQLAGKPAWALADVAPVLAGKQRQTQPQEVLDPPPGFAFLAELDKPLEVGAMVMAATLVYRIGRLAAVAVVRGGGSTETAFAASKIMTALAATSVEEIGAQWDFVTMNRGLRWIDTDAIEEIDWSAVAAIAGETADVPAWEATFAARMAEQEAEAA